MATSTSFDPESAEFAGQLFFRLWRASHTRMADALESIGLTTALFALRNVFGAREGGVGSSCKCRTDRIGESASVPAGGQRRKCLRRAEITHEVAVQRQVATRKSDVDGDARRGVAKRGALLYRPEVIAKPRPGALGRAMMARLRQFTRRNVT
jgi:hypothetical protein